MLKRVYDPRVLTKLVGMLRSQAIHAKRPVTLAGMVTGVCEQLGKITASHPYTSPISPTNR